MKKIIVLLCLSLSAILLIGGVFALTTMYGGSITLIQGAKEVSFPVYLDNEGDIVGFQLDINYSTNDLILTRIEPTARISNSTIVFNNQPPLVKMAVLVNGSNYSILPGDGPVLNLVFNVSDSAQEGIYDINLNELIAVDISAVALNVSETDGSFEVVEPYGFGFLPPISLFENFTLQEGATLPLKFNVTDENGFVADGSVLVRVYNLSLGIDHLYNNSGTGDDFIAINEAEGLYLVNVHTGNLNMPQGTYDIDVSFNNSQTESVGFEIVDKSQGIGRGKNKQ